METLSGMIISTSNSKIYNKRLGPWMWRRGYHLGIDIKMYFNRREIMATRGHTTNLLSSSMYSSIVSCNYVQIASVINVP